MVRSPRQAVGCSYVSGIRHNRSRNNALRATDSQNFFNKQLNTLLSKRPFSLYEALLHLQFNAWLYFSETIIYLCTVLIYFYHVLSTIKFKKSTWLCRSFVRSSIRPSVVCSRLWYVLDRQLLNGWSHRHIIACYVRVRILMNRWFFSNFWDSYFSSYGEFGEFSLRFTAAVSAVAQRSLSGRSAVAQRSLCLQRNRLILH